MSLFVRFFTDALFIQRQRHSLYQRDIWCVLERREALRYILLFNKKKKREITTCFFNLRFHFCRKCAHFDPRVPLMHQWQHIQARSKGWILCWVLSSVCLCTLQWRPFPNQQITTEVWQIFCIQWLQSLGSQKEIRASVKMLVETSCIKGHYVLVLHSSCWKLGGQLGGYFGLFRFLPLCFSYKKQDDLCSTVFSSWY